MHDRDSTPANRAVALATQFLSRVWGPTHDLDAIDELMTEEGYHAVLVFFSVKSTCGTT